MEGSVLLGVRLVPTQYKSVKIDNVNLEIKVDTFKEEAAKKINHPKECIGVTQFHPTYEFSKCNNKFNCRIGLLWHYSSR